LWELTDSETCILAETLLSWGRFSNIILDIEFNTGPRTLQWLELATRVIVPFSARYPEPILRMKSMFSSLPGGGTDKYRWVVAGNDRGDGLKEHFDTFISLPWLEELPPHWGSLTLEKQAMEQLKTLVEG
jgi:hypothetical protein